MKSKYINVLSLTIIGAAVIFGCNPESQSAFASPSEMFKTATITIISTSTPSMTVTDTQTPTSTATLTPLPSLGPENALQIIIQHLQEGEHCTEPCFFGVIPGKTTIGEAHNIFLQLGMPIDFMVPENDKKIYSTVRGLENGLGIAIMLSVQNGLVEDMSVGFEPHDYSISLQANGLKGYSIENLLKQYGVPSAVDFHVSYPHEPGFPSGTAWYDMTLYFESSNVIVKYSDALTKEGELIKACPIRDGFTGVSMWIGETPRYPPSRGVALETASNISLDKFYKIFILGKKNTCIDLDAKMIPSS